MEIVRAKFTVVGSWEAGRRKERALFRDHRKHQLDEEIWARVSGFFLLRF
jgi:hypothetical protein